MTGSALLASIMSFAADHAFGLSLATCGAALTAQAVYASSRTAAQSSSSEGAQTWTPEISQYVGKTLSTAAYGLAVSAATGYVMRNSLLGRTECIVTSLAVIGSMVPAVSLDIRKHWSLKMAAYTGYSMSLGALSMSGLALYVSQESIFIASVGTMGITVGASLAAYSSRHMKTNDLPLSVAVAGASLGLAAIGLASCFVYSEILDSLALYAGIPVAAGWLFFNMHRVGREAMVAPERSDYIASALRIHLDVLDIFLRLVRVLTRSEERKKKQQRRVR
jgi:FtsH-binding integral membrane protein